MSKLEVKILHQNYVLTCPDGQEAQLLEAVERVEQQFEQLRESNKLRSRENVGVLLSVKLAFENLELREQLHALQQQLTELQGTAPNPAESERLQALEAQAARDHQIAQQLVLRLDQALAEEIASPVKTDDLDNAPGVELPAAAAESQ